MASSRSSRPGRIPHQGLWRAVQCGVHFDREQSRPARRWLHHRPTNRIAHGGWRCAVLSRLIPAIKYFGGGLAAPLAPEASRLISDMSVEDIQGAYVLYIAAGSVAAGGIIGLFRSLPIILKGLRGGLAVLRATGATSAAALARTETYR